MWQGGIRDNPGWAVIDAGVYSQCLLLLSAGMISTFWLQLVVHGAVAIALFYALFYTALAFDLLLRGTPPAFASAEARQHMRELVRISRPVRTLRSGQVIAFILMVAGCAAALWLKRGLPLVLTYLGASVLFWSWVRVGVPASVLFLATSSPWGLVAQQNLKHAVAPRRVMSLLDVEYSGAPATARELTLDCVRVVDDQQWWATFQELAWIVRVIVVDVRLPSAHVATEVEFIRHAGLLRKTIMIVGDHGQAGVLQGLPLKVAIEGNAQPLREAVRQARVMLELNRRP